MGLRCRLTICSDGTPVRFGLRRTFAGLVRNIAAKSRTLEPRSRVTRRGRLHIPSAICRPSPRPCRHAHRCRCLDVPPRCRGERLGAPLPQWFRDAFERITNFGLSGWFLFPFGFILLCLAGADLAGPAAVVAGRAGGACGALRLFVSGDRRAGPVRHHRQAADRPRAPHVGGHDDPFAYMPFIWRPEYASMPSGHATTAVAAAIAIGAIWPRTRWVMWLYALTIMFSRVVVLAHHPSDVIAGALVGAAGRCPGAPLVCGAAAGVFAADLRPYPGPSLRRIAAALRQARLRTASHAAEITRRLRPIEPGRDAL